MKFIKNNYRRFFFNISALFIFLSIGTIFAFGQKGETVEKQIRFARGKSSATMKGFIADRMTTHDYIVEAKAGQKLSINLVSARKDVQVYVLLTNQGIYPEKPGKRSFTMTLPEDGAYIVHVEPVRDKIPYTLTVSVK